MTLAVAFAPTLFGASEFDAQGYFGTFCSFGFLSVYLLISLAAPIYLHKIGALTAVSVVVSLLGASFTIVPFIGVVGIRCGTLFRPPDFPNSILVWIYLAYLLVGGGLGCSRFAKGNLAPAKRCLRTRTASETATGIDYFDGDVGYGECT